MILFEKDWHIMIRNEMNKLYYISSQNLSDLNDFTWDKFHCELAATQ